MKAALLLVDLQNDFLDRPGLAPARPDLLAAVATLRYGCRDRGLPVIHIHTVVKADGSNRMPHWVRSNTWTCVEGTRGAEAPPSVAPLDGEQVFHKPCFSGFGNARLDPFLRDRGIDTVIVAGIYLHGCVRSTILDAYERGYTVWVADDAVGSTEPVHAAESRQWLASRAAEFLPVAGIRQRLAVGRDAQG